MEKFNLKLFFSPLKPDEHFPSRKMCTSIKDIETGKRIREGVVVTCVSSCLVVFVSAGIFQLR